MQTTKTEFRPKSCIRRHQKSRFKRSKFRICKRVGSGCKSNDFIDFIVLFFQRSRQEKFPAVTYLAEPYLEAINQQVKTGRVFREKAPTATIHRIIDSGNRQTEQASSYRCHHRSAGEWHLISATPSQRWLNSIKKETENHRARAWLKCQRIAKP